MIVSPGGGDTIVAHIFTKPHSCCLQHQGAPEADPSADATEVVGYMAGIARNHDFFVLSNGGIEDHVHLLIQLPATLALAEAVSLSKSNSSRWMTEHGARFEWQEGYGAFSVSASNLGRVERYIQNQAVIRE